MNASNRNRKLLYCRKCGAEVYSNEKRCRNCGAKTTDRKVKCIILSILCVFFFLGYMTVSDYDSGYDIGFKEGKAEGMQEGTDETTEKYEDSIEELKIFHEEELENVKDTYYKKGKEDGVANYKKKLKDKQKNKKKKQEKKKEDKKEDTEQTQQDSDAESLKSDLKDAWHKLTGEYVPTEDEIIDISTAQVLAEFDANQVACKQKYDGKYVRVTDTINSIGTTVWGDTYISIGSDFWDDIQCFMYKDQIDKVANCSEGTQVTVVGWVDCGSMKFKIGDARITNF